MTTSNSLALRMMLSVILILLTTSISSNPFNPVMILTERDAGSIVSIKRGQALQIVLPTNPTTGYQWEAISFSNYIIRQDAITISPHSELYGSGAVAVFHFMAYSPGQTDLRIGYFRSFEPDKRYRRLFHIKIIVT